MSRFAAPDTLADAVAAAGDKQAHVAPVNGQPGPCSQATKAGAVKSEGTEEPATSGRDPSETTEHSRKVGSIGAFLTRGSGWVARRGAEAGKRKREDGPEGVGVDRPGRAGSGAADARGAKEASVRGVAEKGRETVADGVVTEGPFAPGSPEPDIPSPVRSMALATMRRAGKRRSLASPAVTEWQGRACRRAMCPALSGVLPGSSQGTADDPNGTTDEPNPTSLTEVNRPTEPALVQARLGDANHHTRPGDGAAATATPLSLGAHAGATLTAVPATPCAAGEPGSPLQSAAREPLTSQEQQSQVTLMAGDGAALPLTPCQPGCGDGVTWGDAGHGVRVQHQAPGAVEAVPGTPECGVGDGGGGVRLLGISNAAHGGGGQVGAAKDSAGVSDMQATPVGQSGLGERLPAMRGATQGSGICLDTPGVCPSGAWSDANIHQSGYLGRGAAGAWRGPTQGPASQLTTQGGPPALGGSQGTSCGAGAAGIVTGSPGFACDDPSPARAGPVALTPPTPCEGSRVRVKAEGGGTSGLESPATDFSFPTDAARVAGDEGDFAATPAPTPAPPEKEAWTEAGWLPTPLGLVARPAAPAPSPHTPFLTPSNCLVRGVNAWLGLGNARQVVSVQARL